jgi:hypothetical protein
MDGYSEPSDEPSYPSDQPSEPSEEPDTELSEAAVRDAVEYVYAQDPFVFAASCINPIPDPGAITDTDVIESWTPESSTLNSLTGTLYPLLVDISFDTGHRSSYAVDFFLDDEGSGWRVKVNDCHGWHLL